MEPISPDDRRTTVQLPPLFTAFLEADQEPPLNPHYSAVRVARQSYVGNSGKFDSKMVTTVARANFAYFAAIIAPNAPLAKYETLVDWGNWIFPYDDLFDDGELSDNPDEAASVFKSLMSVMESSIGTVQCSAKEAYGTNYLPARAYQLPESILPTTELDKSGTHERHDCTHGEPKHWLQLTQGSIVTTDLAAPELRPKGRRPLVAFHDTIWDRLLQGSPVGTQRRYFNAMAKYASGAMKHVLDYAHDRLVGTEEMLETRVESGGVSPIFHLFEYAQGVLLPDEVFDNPLVQEIESLGIEFVIIYNDMLSYRKEELEGVTHNLVTSFRLQGKSAQEAFDAVGDMLQSRYARWEFATTNLPSWGGPIDSHVRTYVQGVQNVVIGNLWWSFESGRYFGEHGQEIKRTGKMDVMEFPDYLNLAVKQV